MIVLYSKFNNKAIQKLNILIQKIAFSPEIEVQVRLLEVQHNFTEIHELSHSVTVNQNTIDTHTNDSRRAIVKNSQSNSKRLYVIFKNIPQLVIQSCYRFE